MRPPRPGRSASVVLTAVLMMMLGGVLAGPLDSAVHAAAPAAAEPAADPSDLSARGWVWPVASFRLARAFVAPAHEYGPGHRGIDLEVGGGADVLAPAGGVVAFSGMVAGRGVVTIDHRDGLVTTLEPVSGVLAPGAEVAQGEIVGRLSAGGHVPAGHLHFGVRLHGAYINPLLLVGEVPRAVLLPCCA